MKGFLIGVGLVVLVFGSIALYGWIADDPKVLTGVLVALVCMSGAGGALLGGLLAVYLVRTGARMATDASASAAVQVRETYHHRLPAAGQVVDGEALPLPSQGALATTQAAWLPGLRTWEVKGDEGPEPDAG